MPQQTDESVGWPDKPRAIAIVVLACIAGGLVWSFHHLEIPAFIGTLVLGCVAGFLAGGLVGVYLYPSLTMMFMFVGLFEGLARGWSSFGVIGAILGGTVGMVIAMIVCMLPLILVTFIMVLCGVDPFVNADSASESPISDKPDASN
jgi:hypothetical protein